MPPRFRSRIAEFFGTLGEYFIAVGSAAAADNRAARPAKGIGAACPDPPTPFKFLGIWFEITS